MGLIPDSIGFFIWPNPSSHAVARGLTPHPTEMSIRNLAGVKGSQHKRLTTSPP
jgi:hypothetical protein